MTKMIARIKAAIANYATDERDTMHYRATVVYTPREKVSLTKF